MELRHWLHLTGVATGLYQKPLQIKKLLITCAIVLLKTPARLGRLYPIRQQICRA